VFKIDHSCALVLGHYLSAMKKELSPKQYSLSVVTTGGAVRGRTVRLIVANRTPSRIATAD
jgi:hypothetical protein